MHQKKRSCNSFTKMENSTFDKMDNPEKMIKGDGTDNIEVFRKVIFEPIRIGAVSTLDEMDCKVLQFQNKKLEMKMQECQRIEAELQQRIQQLEKRQSQDKTVLNVVNHYWNRLNDDIGAVLLDVDEEYENDSDNQIESEVALSFINELSSWDESHVDENLVNSVQISTSAVAKIIRAYDHILYKNEKIVSLLKQHSEEFSSDKPVSDCNHTHGRTRPLPELPGRADAENKDCEQTDSYATEKSQPASKTSVNCRTKKETKRKKRSSHKVTLSKSKTISCTKDTINDFAKVTATVKSSLFEENVSNDFTTRLTKKSSRKAEKGSRKQDDDDDDDDDTAVYRDIKLLVMEIVNKVSTESEVNSNENTLNDGSDAVKETAESKKLNNADKSNKLEKCFFDDENRAGFFDGRRFDDGNADGDGNASILKELRNLCVEITHDNVRLQNVINSFQNQQQKIIINEQEITNVLAIKESEYEEWKSRVDELEYENEKLKYKKTKIEHHLADAAETLEKLKARERNQTKSDLSVVSGNKKTEEMDEELLMQRELALSRSLEVEALRMRYQNNLDIIEELEKRLNELPEDVVEETTEYKCLQSHFSVLYNDTMLIKDQIEEYHAHIQTLNATFANKLEMTETEDLMTLRKLQTDLMQMQQVNSQLRREYQMLKIEFERNLIANEQTGPLNKEMRHLLARLQKHNKHLKHEAQRYKRKYKELSAELNLLSKPCYNDSKCKVESESGNNSDFDDTDYTFDISDDFLDFSSMKEEPLEVKKEKLDSGFDETEENSLSLYDRPIMAIAIKQEPDSSSSDSPSQSKQGTNAIAGPSRICSKMSKKRRKDAVQEYKEIINHFDKELRSKSQEVEDIEEEKLCEDEYVQDLRNQLKKAESEQKELKLLLDTYKGVNRDKREKVQLLLAEKKLKSDIEDTKNQMRRILEIKRENRKKLADEDALRKIKYLEEQNFLLLRQINVHKQEEEALLSEMEVTNQAFEDMQEQNSRLIQQLREKDDANSKLMAERIKSNLLYKITREEKESLQALINATSKQLDSVTTVMNELEEKEQIYQIAINNVEKEMNLRQQALELHKKKTFEYTQCASELKHNFEKYAVEIKEIKQQIVEKSSTFHSETFKHNRLQEEIAILRKKVEQMKKVETPDAPDIVLVEEVREYKEILTCQSCKVRRKDAVLTKCFHVFCWECLRTRYETRHRKCPKCNATFGANDYHRLFFAN